LINTVHAAFISTNVTLDDMQLAIKELIISWHGKIQTSTCPSVLAKHNGLFFRFEDGYEDQDGLRETVACTCEVLQLQDLADNMLAILTDPTFLKVYQGSLSLQAYLEEFQLAHNYTAISTASYATLTGLAPVLQVVLSQPKTIDLIKAILNNIEPDPLQLMQEMVCPDLPRGSFNTNQPHLKVGNNIASVSSLALERNISLTMYHHLGRIDPTAVRVWRQSDSLHTRHCRSKSFYPSYYGCILMHACM
jgi:hypothetical protein